MKKIYIVSSTESILPAGLKEAFSNSGRFEQADIILIRNFTVAGILPDTTYIFLYDDTITAGLIEYFFLERATFESCAPVIFISTTPIPVKTIISLIQHPQTGITSLQISFEELMQQLNTLDKGKSSWVMDTITMQNFIEEIASPSQHNNIKYTERELLVIREAQLGSSIEEAAHRLGVSKHTIISHRRNILKKAGVTSFMKVIASL